MRIKNTIYKVVNKKIPSVFILQDIISTQKVTTSNILNLFKN